MECEFPTVNSNKDEIKAIFEETKTIAIVGLSPDMKKLLIELHSICKMLVLK